MSLLELSRRKGARLEYQQPGVYRVYGDDEIGAVMALEAVQQAVRAYCRANGPSKTVEGP